MSDSLLSVTGRIFDIQRFSTHDGPGVRTLVFLKGCPLRCRWCCNPESQSYEIQPMTRGGKRRLVGRDVTVEEVLAEVKCDRPYYVRSGGGVTLSGGESLGQPEFATALLAACMQSGIDTAMETTGFAETATVDRFLPVLDHVLMDIKHMDSRKHEQFTTRPNERILHNARHIAEHAKHLVIRVPVIPTFNDTEAEIGAIAAFAASLPRVQEMHLLPYHRLGQDKYAGLGRPYTLEDITPPSSDTMQRLLRVVESHGLTAQLGG